MPGVTYPARMNHLNATRRSPLLSPLLLGSLLALWAVGCGGKSDTPDPTAPPALEEVCVRLAAARCGSVQACCVSLPTAHRDTAACLKAERAACLAASEDLALALAAGDAAPDQGRLQACEAVFATAACASPSADALTPTCGAVFVDQAAAGAGCGAHSEGLACAGGAGRCVAASGKGGVTCLAWAQVGEDCAAAPCEPPLRCALTGGTKRCVAPAAVGAACVSPVQCAEGTLCEGGKCVEGGAKGAACAAPGTCGTALVCDTDNGVCVPRVGAREACLGTPHCAEGLHCVGKRLVGTCGQKAGENDPCATTAECGAGLSCDPTHERCVPTVGEGVACKSAGDCDTGMGCDPADWTCRTLPGEGQPCMMGVAQCAPPLSCFDAKKGQGLCKPRVGAGGTCYKHNNCKEGMGCVSGACQPAPANGKPCMDSFICGAGYCSHDGDSHVCKPWVATGGACPGGHECGPGDSCVQQKDGSLRCVAIPGDGESCLYECAGALVCRHTIQPGLCWPQVCVAAP